MKNMKKFLVAGIAALSLILTGCNGAGNNNSSSDNPSSDNPSSSDYRRDGEVAVTGVALVANELEGSVGDKPTLTADVYPENATNKTLMWSTTDSSVVTVKNGKLNFVRPGDADIIVRTYDGGYEDTCHIHVGQYLTVAMVSDEYCKITVANPDAELLKTQKSNGRTYDFYQFEVDDIVYFTADYDVKSYELYGAALFNADDEGKLVNVCGTIGEQFYTPLPKDVSTVIITCVGEEIGAQPEVEYYPINNASTESADIVAVDGIARSTLQLLAAANKEVKFDVSIRAGYEFTGEVTATSDAGTVNVVLGADGYYSFIMPKGQVTITIGTVAAKERLTIVDENNMIDAMYINGQKIRKTIGYAYYGDALTFDFVETDNYNVVAGLEVLETGDVITLEDLAEGLAMPAFGITLVPVLERRTVKVNLHSSSNIELVQFVVDPETSQLAVAKENVVGFNETIYIYAICNDNFNVRQIFADSYTFVQYYGATTTYTNSAKLLTEVQPGLYEFTLSNRSLDDIDIYVVESDSRAYANTGIVGAYVGVYSWSAERAYNDFSATYNSIITSDGTWIEGYTSNYPSAYYVDLYSDAQHMGMANDGSKQFLFTYEDNVLFTSKYKYTSSTPYLVDTYKYVYIKKLNPTDPDSMYTVKSEGFYNGYYYALEAYRDGELYATCFVDYYYDMVYAGVTFKFYQGTSVADDNAVYDVYKGARLIAEVGYYGEKSGAVNRELYDGYCPKAMFKTNTGEEMYIDGFDHAYYQGQVWNLKFSGNSVVGKIPGSKDELHFNIIPELHFAQDVEVVKFVPKNQLEGRIFTGKAYRYVYRTSTSGTSVSGMTIEFIDDKHVIVSIPSTSSYVLPIGCTDDEAIDACVYSIDGNVVTMTVYANDDAYYYYNYYQYDELAPVTWKFTLSDDWTTLTCTTLTQADRLQNDLPNSDYYFLPNGALVCNEQNGYVAK